MAAIEALRARVNASQVPEGSIPERTIKCVVPDLGRSYVTKLEDGKLGELQDAAASNGADATLTARSDDLISLLEGKLNVATAFLMGRIKIDASASDMLLIRKLF